MTGFYEVGPIRQIAINLFYGWGYNFYRVENQLRADDQLVRRQAEALLAAAVASLAEAEADYRRDNLPTPTRANPLPDPSAVAHARTLERLVQSVSRLKSRLAGQPVPENDRVTQRHRNEADTLLKLVACDEQLIGRADLLRSLVAGKSSAEILESAADVDEGVAAIQATLTERALLVI